MPIPPPSAQRCRPAKGLIKNGGVNIYNHSDVHFSVRVPVKQAQSITFVAINYKIRPKNRGAVPGDKADEFVRLRCVLRVCAAAWKETHIVRFN